MTMIGFRVFLFKLEVLEFDSVTEIEAFTTNAFGFLATKRLSARKEAAIKSYPLQSETNTSESNKTNK